MSLIDRIERLQRIDNLIRHKATGSPKELAERLEISESTLYEDMNDLRTMGAEIIYCRYYMSYKYVSPVKLIIKMQPLEQKEITGGHFLSALRKFRSTVQYYYGADTFIPAGEMYSPGSRKGYRVGLIKLL
jgi:predicted DNA-binding transcriptional regulator YafY